MSDKNLQQHCFSDKIKWILTLLAFILVGVMLAGILCGWFDKKDEAPKTDEEQTEHGGDDEANADNVLMPEIVKGEGVEITSTPIPVALYGEYGISPLAASAYTLTATITPTNATDKAVDWKIEFVNPSSTWASGKTVTNFGKITPTSDGALTANFEVVAAFAEQLKITATSRQNSEASASCIVDYAKRISSISAVYTISGSSGSQSYTFPFMAVSSGYTEKASNAGRNISIDLTGANNKVTPSVGVGTVDDSFTYTYTISYTSDWIDALKAQKFTPAATAGTKIALSSPFAVGGLLGVTALSSEDVTSVALDMTYGSSGVYNRFATAARAMSGKKFFELGVTATGTYSTFTASCPVYAPIDVFNILVQGVGMNQSSMTV